MNLKRIAIGLAYVVFVPIIWFLGIVFMMAVSIIICSLGAQILEFILALFHLKLSVL